MLNQRKVEYKEKEFRQNIIILINKKFSEFKENNKIDELTDIIYQKDFSYQDKISLNFLLYFHEELQTYYSNEEIFLLPSYYREKIATLIFFIKKIQIRKEKNSHGNTKYNAKYILFGGSRGKIYQLIVDIIKNIELLEFYKLFIENESGHMSKEDILVLSYVSLEPKPKVSFLELQQLTLSYIKIDEKELCFFLKV
jgi:hypothetical protein